MQAFERDHNQIGAQSLLNTRGAGSLLRQLMQLPCDRAALCSGFIRSEALASLLAGRDPSWGGRCLVRWLPNDLRSGASDLESLDIANKAGMRLFMRTNFHGKIYAVPPHGVLLGSANLTASGQGMSEYSNVEVSALIECSTEHLDFVDRLFDGACEVTPELKQLLETHLRSSTATLQHSDDWPPEILDRIGRPTPNLIVSECLWSRPTAVAAVRFDSSLEAVHDRDLLGISDSGISDNALRERLDQSTVVFWLISVLQKSGGEAYFGQLTAILHRQLSKDPTMQRVEVKRLLSNLLAWIEVVGSAKLAVDRPHYSERVSLVNPARPSGCSLFAV